MVFFWQNRFENRRLFYSWQSVSVSEQQHTSCRLISLVGRDSFMLTSNISDHSTLLLLLAGVGADNLLDDFWAEAGDLLSPRRVNDLKNNNNNNNK